jgi:ribonucleotide reductase beta subunit family protein with ferritin-like domain
MNPIEFIEQYCVIKDKDNNFHHIKLKDYQIAFINYIKNKKINQIEFITWYERTQK